ncbi:OmpA family protein [Teichococcus vastitatis]|uniref:OmpA family protein n=1 Tax=Teichococcus vastitatis TaxID=2307076 RepID=UPI000E73E400|nr:OmpA family protein [Pseudoroseomonas vastitatis]
MGPAGGGRRHWRAGSARATAALLLGGLLAAGCSADPRVTGINNTAPVTNRAAPPEAPQAMPLDQAVASLTHRLLARVPAPAQGRAGSGEGATAIAIDPFIDQGTGTETEATRSIVAKMVERTRRDHPNVTPHTFTPDAVAERPLTLLGSIAAAAEQPGGAHPDGFQIQAVLADLRSGRVVDSATAWVRAEDIDTTPAPFFRDSPGWLPDTAAAAYLRTTAAGPGEPVDPLYLQGLTVQALVASGMVAYEAGQYDEAFNRYVAAAQLPAGDQMRVYNGVYLATRALGRPADAEAAFGRLVEFGLRHQRLSIRFLFPPGSTALLPTVGSRATNRMWIRQIAEQAVEHTACLELAGHASPTGSAAANERLSLARAEALRARLVAARPELRDRIHAVGFGARYPLVGTGTDDASDVLDRRVEIEPVACSAAGDTAGARPSPR